MVIKTDNVEMETFTFDEGDPEPKLLRPSCLLYCLPGLCAVWSPVRLSLFPRIRLAPAWRDFHHF